MKILLVADVHNRIKTTESAKKRTLEGLGKVIEEVKADLIVFLGDVVHGPDFGDYTALYENYLREVLDLTGITPFAFVFGNHDDECALSKEDILQMLYKYDNSLTIDRNYVLEMCGEKLLFLDSGSYYDGKESLYDYVREDTINWAKEKLGDSKAIAFQHIIVPDIFGVMEQKRGFIPFWAHGDRKSVRFKQGVAYEGNLGERPCPPEINGGEFKFLSPNLKAICFGHDHLNDFELELDGTKIIQCAGAGYNCYDKRKISQVKLLDTDTLLTKTIYY